MSNSNQEIGQWGEELACKHLENKGYTIVDRNFRRKWGEIDIICSKPVNKNVPRGTNLTSSSNNVPRGTFMNWLKIIFSPQNNSLSINENESYLGKKENKVVFVEVKTLQSSLLKPEDNITRAKQKRLIRSCQLYLSSNNYPIDTDWQIDIVGVLLDKNTGKAKINHLKQAVYFV